MWISFNDFRPLDIFGLVLISFNEFSILVLKDFRCNFIQWCTKNPDIFLSLLLWQMSGFLVLFSQPQFEALFSLFLKATASNAPMDGTADLAKTKKITLWAHSGAWPPTWGLFEPNDFSEPLILLWFSSWRAVGKGFENFRSHPESQQGTRVIFIFCWLFCVSDTVHWVCSRCTLYENSFFFLLIWLFT